VKAAASCGRGTRGPRACTAPGPAQIAFTKVVPLPIGGLTAADSIEDWACRYLDAAVRGVRSAEIADKIALAADPDAGDPQGCGFGPAPATVNAHLASLSGFTTWVIARDPAALPHGNPCAKASDLPLPPLEPRVLSSGQSGR
jgi:hypothetical protein